MEIITDRRFLFVNTNVESLTNKMIALLKIDDLAKKFELAQTLQRAGFHLHIGHLFGWIVQWFVLIVALIAATDILGWDQVTDYLKQVVLYIPNVLIAIIILLAGILLANFVERVVHSAVQAAHFASAHFLSHAARWAILVFTFMAVLDQLAIAEYLIRVLFTGLVAMVALAGGLAFGLGGREQAARFLERLQKNISSNGR